MPYEDGVHIMRVWRHGLRRIIVAVMAALALFIAGCGSNNSATSSVKVKGGVATYAQLGVKPEWIWPYIPSSQDTVSNTQVFQWLMYRPLYMFGNDGNSVSVNYALSPASPPVYSDGGKTVVISLKNWKWSDGESVDAQDVMFWLNMMKAEKVNYAGYAPGVMPDNLVSYSATGPNQVTLHLNRAYSSYWFTYNQLAEITPMPQAWDVTSLAARPGSGGCSSSVAKCPAVYKFLAAQATDTRTWATSRIWGTVDGPWRLSGFPANSGSRTNAIFVPNPKYSGSPKPRLSEFRLVDYADDKAAYQALKAGKLDVTFLPIAKLPKATGTGLPAANPLGPSATLQRVSEFSIFYYQPNFNNPTLGAVFRQLYVRQALQYLDNQPGMDATVFRGYAVPGSGGVPNTPSNRWQPATQLANGGQGPYPYSTAKATSLLTGHGWQEVGGVMTCRRPGTAPTDCGAGIARNQKLAFTLDWATGSVSTDGLMLAAYKADAARAGIEISLAGKPFEDLLNELAPCKPGPKCSWDAVYLSEWVFDGPGFEPTGEELFQTGAFSNSGSYSSPTEDKLISETHTSNSLAVFHEYATYTASQLPYIWLPSEYTIRGVASKLHDVHISPIYTVLPEYWYFTR